MATPRMISGKPCLIICEHRTKGLNISMLRSKARPDYVVRGRHALNAVPGYIGMRFICSEAQCFSRIKLHMVEKESRYHTHVLF
ncbi:hypothetical protein RchiOBHm_Chr6g0306841 [Rosa chinensis]|uniref:Uncharacterized protein n=1 Tax=Rosa chinensis TaxID=74649 RepID=A0A2P6Q0A1_ROSCH|nr:hypothetical protein RchiOBHm_Chr6g0306841 [Rosa chinensis]